MPSLTIYLNLKRFDVPVELGGVNRLAPVKDWGAAVVGGYPLSSRRAAFMAYRPTA